MTARHRLFLTEELERRRLLTGSIIQTLASLGGTDGLPPANGDLLINANGALIGTTQRGGPQGGGTIFALPRGTTTPTILAAFNSLNGWDPAPGIVMDANGDIFGETLFTARTGAGNIAPTPLFPGIGSGTIFELPHGSSTITQLAVFNGANGRTPEGDLVLDSAGDLFGTTLKGGTSNLGTVFELPSGSNTITTLVSFTGPNGRHPVAGLSIDSSGDLFGTTTAGGAADKGTVFEIAAGTNSLTTIASFGGTDGSAPSSPLLMDTAGDLFGSASAGGSNSFGTVFEIASGTNAITALGSFNGLDGGDPIGAMVTDSQGDLFGTARTHGPTGTGTIFEVPNGGGAITAVAGFAGSNGGLPYGLVSDNNGFFYGSSQAGGQFTSGTLFRVVPANISSQGLLSVLGTTTDLPASVNQSAPLLNLVHVVLSDRIGQSGLVSVVVYASSDGTIDNSSLLIGSTTTTTSFQSNTPFQVDVPVRDIDASVPAGTYTLLAQAIDPAGNSAIGTTGPTLTVNVPAVSLAGTFTKVTVPPTVTSGQHVAAVATLSITNEGNSPSIGYVGVSLYASPDGTIASGTFITGGIRALQIGANGTARVSISISQIPYGLSGSYVLVAQITNPLGGISVATTTSPITIAASTVSLTGTIDAFTPGSLQNGLGPRGTATVTITNTGDIAVGPLNIDVGLVSQDGTNTVALDSFTVAIALQPGQSKKVTLRYEASVLLSTPAGTYFPTAAVMVPNTAFGTTIVGTMPVSVT